MGACARHVDTRVYIFVACFCVSNTNIAFVQKYVLGVRGPLSIKRSSLASVKVTKFAKRESYEIL